MVKIPKNKEDQQKFLIKALLLFTVLYIFLCMSKQNYFKKMLNTLLGRSETFVNQLGGAGRYHKLTDSDTVESVISQHSGNECTLVVVGADWCGYTKKLYESGELQKAARSHLVLVVDEKHKQAEKIMKETGSRGFPTIAVHCKQRGFGKYEGPRTAKAMIAACSCNSVKNSDTNPKIIKVQNNRNPIEAAKFGCKIYHGPYVYNFREIYDLLEKNKISKQIFNQNELSESLIIDLEKPNKSHSRKLDLINDLGQKTLDDTMNYINKFLIENAK